MSAAHQTRRSGPGWARRANWLAASALLTAALAGAQVPSPTPRRPAPPAPASPPTAAGPNAPAASGESLTLEQALALALANNRRLAAARFGVPVARAGVEVARQRPNPDLLLEASRETPREAITLIQPIEIAGKRGRRIAAAEAGAAAAEAEIARSTAEIRNQVRRAYYALVAAQARLAELAEVRGLAGRVRQAASDRFDAGAAPRLELLQAELALAQASNDEESARGLQAAARSDLNTLLARDPAAALAASGDLAAGSLPAAEQAASLAAAASTELALLDRRLAAQAARVALLSAQRYPDPVVQGALTHDSPPDFKYGWRAGLTVNLPIFHHHQAEVDVEQRTLEQLRAERDATGAQIAGAVFSAAAQAGAQRAQLLRYRDQILPRAREVELMAEDSYRSGQSGLVALLQALQAARDQRLRGLQAGLDYQNALADLERAMGASLP